MLLIAFLLLRLLMLSRLALSHKLHKSKNRNPPPPNSQALDIKLILKRSKESAMRLTKDTSMLTLLRSTHTMLTTKLFMIDIRVSRADSRHLALTSKVCSINHQSHSSTAKIRRPKARLAPRLRLSSLLSLSQFLPPLHMSLKSQSKGRQPRPTFQPRLLQSLSSHHTLAHLFLRLRKNLL